MVEVDLNLRRGQRGGDTVKRKSGGHTKAQGKKA
jgi:hypothetical protein